MIFLMYYLIFYVLLYMFHVEKRTIMRNYLDFFYVYRLVDPRVIEILTHLDHGWRELFFSTNDGFLGMQCHSHLPITCWAAPKFFRSISSRHTRESSCQGRCEFFPMFMETVEFFLNQHILLNVWWVLQGFTDIRKRSLLSSKENYVTLLLRMGKAMYSPS